MRYLCLLLMLTSTGCSSTLETGYMPRKLGASEEMRRGYYAQPFTPQAKAAKEYEHDFGDAGRMGTSYGGRR